MKRQTLKQAFLMTVILSLVAAALLGIIVFVAGNFGIIELKILLSALAVGLLSLAGLANLQHLESKTPWLHSFALASTVLSAFTLIIVLVAIWSEMTDPAIGQIAIALLIASFSSGHISLLLRPQAETTAVTAALGLAVISIVTVAGILIYLIFEEFGDHEAIFRLLGVAAILDVLGTTLVPIVRKYLV
jgi:hypothetical protein